MTRRHKSKVVHERDPHEVDAFRMDGHTIRKGETVKVLPSQKGKRDGFVATVRYGRLADDGTLEEVAVYGAPGARVPSCRTFRPERIKWMRQVRKAD